MVHFSDAHLDRAFAALADPMRRAIIERLAKVSELAVSEIAAPFALSLPGVIKHLDVLARARLIERSKIGRSVRCRLTGEGMQDALAWLTRYQRFRTASLAALARVVEDPARPQRSRPAAGSRAAFRPRQARPRRSPRP